jgi:hypothetical protein
MLMLAMLFLEVFRTAKLVKTKLNPPSCEAWVVPKKKKIDLSTMIIIAYTCFSSTFVYARLANLSRSNNSASVCWVNFSHIVFMLQQQWTRVGLGGIIIINHLHPICFAVA